MKASRERTLNHQATIGIAITLAVILGFAILALLT
jgi:hypothetical protein